MRKPAIAVALLALSACGKGPPPAPATGAPPTGAPASASTSAAATPPAASFVVSAVALRREPTTSERVASPPGGKPLPNAFGSPLQRGERVTVLEIRDDWARVRASDDAEGWLRASTLLDGVAVGTATVVIPADVFDRPDLLAANPRRKLEPGSLLLVLKARPPFSEVNVGSGPNAWVLTERLVTTEAEVGVAKLIEKARWLVRSSRKEEALQILALARSQFPGVALLEALELELNPPPGSSPVNPP